MNTSEILDKAADLIEQRGHWKGWYCGPNGELCTVGALYAAAGVEPQPYEATDGAEHRWPTWSDDAFRAADAASNVLADTMLGALSIYVPDWNDDDNRTEDHVTSALRGAAEAARAEP